MTFDEWHISVTGLPYNYPSGLVKEAWEAADRNAREECAALLESHGVTWCPEIIRATIYEEEESS